MFPKNSDILATGRLDHPSGLLILDQDIDQKVVNEFQNEISNFTGLTMHEAHRKLGHVGEAMVKRTINSSDFKLESEDKPNQICEPCIKGKLRKRTIPKTSGTRDVCEVIAADEQGLLIPKIF